MSTQFIKMTLIITAFSSLPLLADEIENPVTHSNNISSEKSSRGTVTQGVIGAEADENKKLVPDSAPSDTEKDTGPNIRLDDKIIEDIENPELE